MNQKVFSLPQAPILMYHAVEERERPPQYKHFYVTQKEFARQMRELAGRGYEAVSLNTLSASLAGEGAGALPAKPIVLTFDDGYENLFENVHPLLCAMCWPYTVYLVSERVGEKNSWVVPEGYEPTPLLNWAQIREMQKSPLVTFGAHTQTHPNLARLSDAEAEREIRDSKTQLEQELQVPVTHFCYPYGGYTAQTVEAVRAAGFITATTTDHGRVRPDDDPLRLPRVSIYHVPAFSLTYGPGALNFRWRVESRADNRPPVAQVS